MVIYESIPDCTLGLLGLSSYYSNSAHLCSFLESAHELLETHAHFMQASKRVSMERKSCAMDKPGGKT